MMTGLHSSSLEWAWLFASLVASAFALHALIDATKDAAFLVAVGANGPRKIVADSNIRQEFSRLVKSSISLTAAMASLFLAPPPPEYSQLPQSQVGLVAWILVMVVMTGASLLDRLARKRLARYTSQSHPTDPSTGQRISAKGPQAADSPAGLSIPDDVTNRRRNDRAD